MEQLNKGDLIYWRDKDFVQQNAQERIGRNLNDEEIERLAEMVEFDLEDCRQYFYKNRDFFVPKGQRSIAQRFIVGCRVNNYPSPARDDRTD